MNMLFLTHGGTSGSFLHNDSSGKFGLESTFEDFVEIMKIVMHYLNYRLHFFGFTMSIFDAVISAIILSIAIYSVIQIFLNE